MEIPDGATAKMQLNRMGEDLDFFPQEDKEYVLTMVVGVDFITFNPNTKRYRFTMKRCGDFSLTENQ